MPNKAKYVSFEEARTFVKGLNLKSTRSWYLYCKGYIPDLPTKPINIPKAPEYIYRHKGWMGYSNFLGYIGKASPIRDESLTTELVSTIPTPNTTTFYQCRDWMVWDKARDLVRSMGLRTSTEYAQWCKGLLKHRTPKPYTLPTSPGYMYKEWVSWKDFLGDSFRGHTSSVRDNRVACFGIGLRPEMDYQRDYRESRLRDFLKPRI